MELNLKGSLMSRLLKNASDVDNVPIGYSWESEPMKAGFIQTILFAFATKDWNSFHVNPFTLFFFKSNLGGMTCHGDLVLSLTKAGIHKVFRFEEHTEIIARGYDLVQFKRPLRVNMRFYYRYTLLGREIIDHKAECKWRIEVVNDKKKLLVLAIWANQYCPVSKSILGKIVIP